MLPTTSTYTKNHRLSELLKDCQKLHARKQELRIALKGLPAVEEKLGSYRFTLALLEDRAKHRSDEGQDEGYQKDIMKVREAMLRKEVEKSVLVRKQAEMWKVEHLFKECWEEYRAEAGLPVRRATRSNP